MTCTYRYSLGGATCIAGFTALSNGCGYETSDWKWRNAISKLTKVPVLTSFRLWKVCVLKEYCSRRGLPISEKCRDELVALAYAATVAKLPCVLSSVYSRIWKLPVISFLQLPMYVRCAAMRGALQCAMRGAHQFDWHNTCQTLKTAAEHHIQTTV